MTNFDYIAFAALIISVITLIITTSQARKQETRNNLNITRPILIASAFGRMSLQGRERPRNLKRYIAKTKEYKYYTEHPDEQKGDYVFLRIRNTSENSAYKVVIRLLCDEQYKLDYTVDTINKSTEYMILIPPAVYDEKNFVRSIETNIEYHSLSGERMVYSYVNKTAGKDDYKIAHHSYCGYLKKSKTFEMVIDADAIETINPYDNQNL